MLDVARLIRWSMRRGMIVLVPASYVNCVRERVRDSCERAFVTHMRENILCYAFDDSFDHGDVTTVVTNYTNCHELDTESRTV